MDTLLKDLRYAVRTLLKSPAFTVAAVLTIALGVGATTSIFSVVNALILNPPLMQDPDRVVAIWRTPSDERTEGYVSYLDLKDWSARSHSFEEIAAYKPHDFDVTTSDEVERLPGMRVTANFFPLLKITPERGRNFDETEERSGGELVAIIGHDLGQSMFGASGMALNQQIILDGKPHIIIGILPENFRFALFEKPVQVWATVIGETSNLKERGAQVLRAVGRLKPDVTLEHAENDIAAVAANLAHEYPSTNLNSTAYLVSAHQQIVGRDVRRVLWLLLGAVSFILLIACTNTANLLLVRTITRQKESAIRAALGAGRWRLGRQVVTEALVLAFFSGGVGLLIAAWALSAIRVYAANQLPRLAEVQINARVLMFTFVVSLVTGLLFSLVPTLSASQARVNYVLKSGNKGATSSRGLRLWRDGLIVAEVALSFVLVVGAGLMIRSFSKLLNVPPGFDPNNVLTGEIGLTRAAYENPEECARYVDQALARLRALPGVERAAFVAPMPFSGGDVGSDFLIEGRPKPEPGNKPFANNRSITTEYFRAMKIPLLKGRYFNEQDRRGGTGAAIVNQTFVQNYFPNEEVLGQVISNIGANQNEGDPEKWTIVGVVADVHHKSLTKSANPEIYLPYQQNSWTWGNFFIRTTADPTNVAAMFRNELRAVDPTVSITKVRPLSLAISETVAEPRFYTFLFSLFGVIGLLLTMTGVYGLVSYSVAQRTQEIGIRMALGATGQSVLQLVVRQGILLAITGVTIGLAGSFALTKLIETLLFNVKPTDVTTFSAAGLVILGATFFASFIPARRATKVDPIVALRYE
ncbi:MAG TPA: ABC transporter permease [Pyrinomonadaceae bacterium]|nr:ABC transporter permease [Pyrinomonadaceae bacterium]